MIQGQFMFRLLSTDDEELLRSVSFPNPKLAGQEIRALQSDPSAIKFDLVDGVYQVSLEDRIVATAVNKDELDAETWKATLLNQLALFSED